MGALPAGVVIGPLSSLIFEQRFVSLLFVLFVSTLMARDGVVFIGFGVSLSHDTACRNGLNGLALKKFQWKKIVSIPSQRATLVIQLPVAQAILLDFLVFKLFQLIEKHFLDFGNPFVLDVNGHRLNGVHLLAAL